MSIKQISVLMARISLFIIYVWFGVLKVIGQSPASEMVQTLHAETISFIPFSSFIVLFGLFEMLIGIIFLIPRFEKPAFIVFGIHMITTTLPLFIMGDMVWTHVFVPTLEGQYIIKNLALIACALTIAASLEIKKPIIGKIEGETLSNTGF
jgi:uncharacterized membrane protein YphA (DoxX/SURF4 family)